MATRFKNQREYKDSSNKLRKLISEGSVCAECGSTKELQIHHIVPLAAGGKSDEDNLLILCRECHKKKHADDAGTLTKLGIEASRCCQREAYISLGAFYDEVEKLLRAEERLTIDDVFDILESLPKSYKTVKQPTAAGGVIWEQ